MIILKIGVPLIGKGYMYHDISDGCDTERVYLLPERML